MHDAKKRRLEELRRAFRVVEVNGTAPARATCAETIALCLNHKYGRQVVVRKAGASDV